jgi:hypothetical protein
VKSSYIKDDGCDPLLIIPGKYSLKTVRDEQIKNLKINAKLATMTKRTRLNYMSKAKTRDLLRD